VGQDPAAPADLTRWRKGLRQELIARREGVPSEQRRDWNLSISLQLLRSVPWTEGQTVGFCWPHRGEYDARQLLHSLRAQGVRGALPVIEKGPERLMRFHFWAPGTAMEDGPMGIPFPVGSAQLLPNILLVPLVGFGRSGDRLGYGGGYFDRLLASLDPQPLAIGVGYELCQVESTFPQPHDVLMDAIVTERTLRWRQNTSLVEVGALQLRERLEDLCTTRRDTARSTAHTVPGSFPLR